MRGNFGAKCEVGINSSDEKNFSDFGGKAVAAVRWWSLTPNNELGVGNSPPPKVKSMSGKLSTVGCQIPHKYANFGTLQTKPAALS